MTEVYKIIKINLYNLILMTKTIKTRRYAKNIYLGNKKTKKHNKRTKKHNKKTKKHKKYNYDFSKIHPASIIL
jgi:hypothetical protein